MEGGESCNTRLSLGFCSRVVQKQQQQQQQQQQPKQPKTPVLFHLLFPPNLKEEVLMDDADRLSSKTIDDESEVDPKKNEDMSNHSISSNSTDSNCSNKNDTRKKLRLTKEQSTLLEDSFKEHPSLNPTQKVELANKLKLRPRQVEVWFQNRRARNKLKQTEVDCDFLKKYCESLSDENKRLKKELQELRSKKGGSLSPFYIQPRKAARLMICPSCERVERTGDGKTVIGVVDVMVGKDSNKLYTGMDDRTMAC